LKEKNKQSKETIILTDSDRDIFLCLIENPPEPNQALKSAMKRFKEEYEN
jgi:uncharacterized protein (DUF1778 family)